jgi:hypothetical protein
MRLSKKQGIALRALQDNSTNEILFGGGAGGGKSMLGSYWILKMCFKYPKTRWLIGRAVLKTLKETTLNSLWTVMDQQGIRADIHYRYNDMKSIITFVNGSEIMLKDLEAYPSDPFFNELGSLEITGAFVDECNQISEKAWDIVKSRIRYRLDEYGIIPKILGTCNPDKGWIYLKFYQPSKAKELPENKLFIKSLLDDNPYISKHYRTNLLGLDENSKQRLLYGNFEYDDDPASLIDYNRIIDLFSNHFVQTGEKYITVDIARFGSDNTVIAIWSGWRVKMFKYSKLSIVETTEQILHFSNIHNVPLSNIIVDEDGVGGGAKDILKCKGFVNNSTALPNPLTHQDENFANLKSQCYYKLAERINGANIYIECHDPSMRADIIQELEQVKQYQMDKDRKKAIMPKEKVKEIIGRSPDYSDTLMMREWFELRPSINWKPR